MSSIKLFLVTALICVAFAIQASDKKREAKQAELDAVCESAREQKLVPLRQKMIDRCIQKKEFKTLVECETYYADYGERAGGRPAMFYDLPACVKAFEFAQSERSGG